MWQFVHCQIVQKGLTWDNPTANYANKVRCGGAGSTIGIHSDLERLALQRKLVDDFIAAHGRSGATLSGGTLSGTTLTGSTSPILFSISDFEAFGNAIKFNNQFRNPNNSMEDWKKLLSYNNEFLKKYPNLPERAKEYLTLYPLTEEIKMPVETFDSIVKENSLVEIQKIRDARATLGEQDIALLGSFLLPNNTINIVKNKTYAGQNFINNVTLLPLTKNGVAIDVASQNIELRNAPTWVTLDGTGAISKSFNMKIQENAITSTESTNKNFDIVLTDKKTGKVHTEQFVINFLDSENKENVMFFTIPQLTIELFKYMTSK